MSTEAIHISCFIPASPERVYDAWMSSEEHSAFTGSRAVIDPKAGGAFTAGDGYIAGTTRELDEGRSVVQSWRTLEFPHDAPDSLLTVHFDAEDEGTHLTLLHADIPEGQGRRYEEGWLEYYVEPLKRYFAETVGKAPTKKAPAKKAPARKVAAKKAPARKAVAKTAPARKAVAKTAPAKKVAPKNAPAKKAPARRAPEKKAGGKKR